MRVDDFCANGSLADRLKVHCQTMEYLREKHPDWVREAEEEPLFVTREEITQIRGS